MELAIFILSIGAFLWEAFVFMKIWNWFPAEIFSLPAIGMTGALGLLILMIFFRNKNLGELKKKTVEERLEFVFTIAFLYAFVLLLGFIVKLFM